MKKIEQMRNKLETLKADAQNLLDTNDVEGAKAKMIEVKTQKDAIDMQATLDAEDENELKTQHQEAQTEKPQDKTKENANIIRAMLKKVTGKSLTSAENALLLPTTATPAGTNGESYILPQDIRTLIEKKIRQYKSIRDVIGYMPTAALTGSFPIENFETVTGLIDFTDGTDGTESDDIKFTNVSFALKEKAAFIKLSNTLLALSDNALIAYIVEIFSKKAVVTENAMGITALKANKTVKTLATWGALAKSLNVDLDPAVLFGAAIVTNQDGFNFLDEQVDSTGRPLLQPNPADPTKPLFKGYPIVVYSNSQIPSSAATASVFGYAPIFYGNLVEAIKFVDLDGKVGFATSSEAGFMSNTTIARLIEFVDVIQVDKSDKCYIYGQLQVAPKTV